MGKISFSLMFDSCPQFFSFIHIEQVNPKCMVMFLSSSPHEIIMGRRSRWEEERKMFYWRTTSFFFWRMKNFSGFTAFHYIESCEIEKEIERKKFEKVKRGKEKLSHLIWFLSLITQTRRKRTSVIFLINVNSTGCFNFLFPSSLLISFLFHPIPLPFFTFS